MCLVLNQPSQVNVTGPLIEIYCKYMYIGVVEIGSCSYLDQVSDLHYSYSHKNMITNQFEVGEPMNST